MTKSTDMGKRVASLLLTAWLVTPAAATELCRWVDENGVTHFSQMPPEVLLPLPPVANPPSLSSGPGG